jgi:hypothetical protein
MPTDECVTPLCAGNEHLPVLHSGVIIDRVVFGFARPSIIATFVSMSISQCGTSMRASLLLDIHLEILIDASPESRGRSQDTALTACCVNGPTPTENAMMTDPRMAVFLWYISTGVDIVLGQTSYILLVRNRDSTEPQGPREAVSNCARF